VFFFSLTSEMGDHINTDLTFFDPTSLQAWKALQSSDRSILYPASQIGINPIAHFFSLEFLLLIVEFQFAYSDRMDRGFEAVFAKDWLYLGRPAAHHSLTTTHGTSHATAAGATGICY
jgi:hypothetical protein